MASNRGWHRSTAPCRLHTPAPHKHVPRAAPQRLPRAVAIDAACAFASACPHIQTGETQQQNQQSSDSRAHLLISRSSSTASPAAPICQSDNTKGTCSSAHLLISRFSCTNLTFARVSADSSIAWLKPFSPPGRRRGDRAGWWSGRVKRGGWVTPRQWAAGTQGGGNRWVAGNGGRRGSA